MYVIRKAATIKKKIVKNVINLILFQHFNEYLKLNKTLNFDNLKIFKNNFFDKLSLKQLQNNSININNVKLKNKSFFFKKQNDKLNI